MTDVTDFSKYFQNISASAWIFTLLCLFPFPHFLYFAWYVQSNCLWKLRKLIFIIPFKIILYLFADQMEHIINFDVFFCTHFHIAEIVLFGKQLPFLLWDIAVLALDIDFIGDKDFFYFRGSFLVHLGYPLF